MSLAPEELEELAAGYALDALDEPARARFEQALEQDPAAPAALERARRGAAAMGAALPPVRPRKEVWQAIEAHLGTPAAARRGGARAVLPWALVVVAAAAALFFWRRGEQAAERAHRAHNLAQFRAAEVDARDRALTSERGVTAQCRRDLAAAQGELGLKAEAVALLELPATRVVALAPQGGAAHSGSALVNLTEKRAFVVVAGLTAQAGKDYELWVIKGDKKLAAGLLHGADRGQTIARVDPALLADGADALAVTLEPAGGGDTPRGPIVLVALLKS